MGKTSSENRNGIKQSLIASVIFVILLEPIIKIGKNWGKGVVLALVDFFYYSCSHTNWEGVVGYCVLLAFTFYILKSIGDSIPGAFPSKNQESKSVDSQGPVDSKGSVDKADSNALEENLASIATEINKLQQRKKKLERLDKLYKWLSRINIIIQTLFFCYVLIFQFAAAAMNESFDRRITQIAPYTDSQNIEIIKSHWVQMETKSDYEEIVQEINEIRNENNLK